MILNKILILTLIFLTSVNFATTKETFNLPLSQSLGFSVNNRWETHKTEIRTLSKNPNCCSDFLTGDGNSYGFSLEYLQKLNEDDLSFSVGFSLGYQYGKSLIFYDEQEAMIVNGEPYTGIFRHSVEFKSNYLIPALIINMEYSDFVLRLNTGFGIFISNDYQQKEEIIYPEDRGVFEDTKTRVRNLVNSSINELATPLDLSFSIGYKLPLNNDYQLFVVPSFYGYYQSSIIKELTWYNYGFGLRFSFIFNF